ncbi:MAG: SIR2 family protein [bacterium]|nr:SIR2 family protein [bacterium]
MSERYYAANQYGIHPNYERVLGEMTALASWLSPSPFGNPTMEALSGCEPFSSLAWSRESPNEFAGRQLILSQQEFLLEKLARYIRECCKRDFPLAPGFSDYAKFFRRLQEHFDVGIYNLNYDTVARTAWPEAFSGFDEWGFFDPLIVAQRRKWGFIYHLHGSVHHCISHSIARPWIVWKNSLEEEFTDRGVPPVDMAQDFRSIPLTTLISGGFKLDQILAEPYQTFYATLVRHIHEASAILIVGYGFGDLHVNRAIQNRFALSDCDARPHPKVAILEKSSPERYRTGRLEIHQFWSWQVKHTLQTSFHDGSKFQSEDERRIEELMEKGECEIDVKNRSAIWHGGVGKAFIAVDKFIEWLAC